MKNITIVVFLILGTVNAIAQITDVEEKFNLPEILRESSGAIFYNGKLITHNDSGGQNALFELDTISGEVTRTITIDNATNKDWEDIAQDDTSIYIGDIGNNDGNRTDLKIYKINKNDYMNSDNVTAEIINFNYSDQIDFTSNPNDTEWDSEALIALDTSLFLLTKNWVNGITKAYSIPKNSGTHTVNPLSTTLDSDGMITGSTYNQLTEKIYSVGYNSLLQPFICISEDFTGNDIFSGTNTRIQLSSLGFEQTEAITHISDNRYFITSESFKISIVSDDAKLIAFSTNDTVLSLEELPINQISLYPNPATNQISIDYDGIIDNIKIYDKTGKVILVSSNTKSIKLPENLAPGVYFLMIESRGNVIASEKFIVE